MVTNDLTHRERVILDEVRAISNYPMIRNLNDGWVEAFHVKHFHDRTPHLIRVLTLDQVRYTLRRLAAKGLIEKEPRQSRYRLNAR